MCNKNEFILKLCDKYDINLFDKGAEYSNAGIVSGKEFYEIWLNQACATINSRKIYLGIFKDKELRIAVFFHELWHVLKKKNKNETQYDYERITTLRAIRYAKLLGIYLSLSTIIKLYKYLNSHSWVGDGYVGGFSCM